MGQLYKCNVGNVDMSWMSFAAATNDCGQRAKRAVLDEVVNADSESEMCRDLRVRGGGKGRHGDMRMTRQATLVPIAKVSRYDGQSTCTCSCSSEMMLRHIVSRSRAAESPTVK